MGQKEKGWLSILFDFLRSVKLTIFLLILLALISVIGTVIKQNAPQEEYIRRYGIELYNILDFFNLFDMYHSWWFSAILLFLVLNLIACSLHRLPGVLKQIFREAELKGIEASSLKTLPFVEQIRLHLPPEDVASEIDSLLKKRFKRPKRIDGETYRGFYSEKGRFSRLGVYITHLSILIILVGGMIGSLFGFRGFVNILEGETVDHIFLRGKDGEMMRPIGFSLRCDDFRVIFYDLERPEKIVKEYMSDLTVLEEGKEVLKRTIEVNHPLQYRGLTFYQSSYGTIPDLTIGVQWKGKQEKRFLRGLEGETIGIPESQMRLRLLRYVPQVHNFGEGVQVALFEPNRPPKTLWVLKNFPKMEQPGEDSLILTLEEVKTKEYTGLQVTKDPGVWIVWVGCGLMIVGLILAFFYSHQRVWVVIPLKGDGEIVLAGSTNKNRVGFEKRFREIAEEVRNLVSGSKR
ncbi:MAG: cytochrome c biogenesis protein ResB [Desulfobacterota bacterium]|nr:cytochrome c biogenesis protein ResB [Thermodesulfobacteriota bacterium]